MFISDMNPADFGQKVLVYGPPKLGGKTFLAGMLAAKYQLIWVDFENGWKTLKQLPLDWQKNISYFGIKDTKDGYEASKLMDDIVNHEKFAICALHKCKLDYNGTACPKCKLEGKDSKKFVKICDLKLLDRKKHILVLDSVSQWSTSSMAASFRGAATTFRKAEFDNYNKQGFNLDLGLSYIQQSENNWVLIAHEESLELEDSKERLVPRAGTRNFSRTFAKYFDHVVYSRYTGTKFSALSGANQLSEVSAQVGSRLGVNIDEKAMGLLAIFDENLEIKELGRELLSKTTGITTKPDELVELHVAADNKAQEAKVDPALAESGKAKLASIQERIAAAKLEGK